MSLPSTFEPDPDPDVPDDAEPIRTEQNGEVTLAKQGGITFIGDIVKKSFGFVLIALITRLVSPSVYGLFVLATSVILFVQVFATLGLPRAIDYYVPQFIAREEFDRVRGVFVQVVGYVTVVSVVVGALLFVGAGPIAELFGEPALRLALMLLAFALPLLAAFGVLLTSFNALKQLKYRVYVRDLVRTTARLLVTAGLLLAGFGLLGVVGGYIIGLAVCVVFGAALLIKRTHTYAGNTFSWVPPKELLWYSVPLAFASVIYVALGQIDYVIVGYFLSSQDVGFYRVGYMLGENLLIFFGALAPVFKPLIAEERTNDASVRNRYRTAVRWSIALTLPLLLILTLGATTYLSLVFTPQYAVAAPIIAVLAVGYLVSIAGGGPGGSLLQGLGYSRLVFLNTALLFIVNIAVSVALVPRIGILGAAVGSAAALAIAGSAALVELYYYRGVHPFTGTLARVVAAAVPAAIAGGAVVLFVDVLAVRAVLLPIVVVIAYGLAIGALGGVTENDIIVAGEIDPRVKQAIVRVSAVSFSSLR